MYFSFEVRHSLATHLLADGYHIPTVQKVEGHKAAKTMMIYSHVENGGEGGGRCPIDVTGRE
jgi:site-specific recombinase XerD